MWGAVIGDLAGSIYEYDQTKKIKPVKVDNLIEDNSFYSDDTILTIAVLDAFLNDKKFEYYLRKYCNDYKNYKPDIKPYFKNAFSQKFIDWANSNRIGESKGNGAMMRISPVGFLSENEQELLLYCYYATYPSHNSKEAIHYSLLIAKIIYLARKGLTKNDIKLILDIKYEFKPFEKFNTTCSKTIDNCLYALFETNSFEEALKLIISFGGDTDTNAAIVGSMAESFYGIDEKLIEQAKEKIPEEFTKKLVLGYSLKK